MSENDGRTGDEGARTDGERVQEVVWLLLCLFVFALTIGLSLLVYPKLPERIPLHFGRDGLPDRLVEKTILNWLTPPLLGGGMALFFLLMGKMMPAIARKWPKLISIPRKKEFLALPPEQREPVYRELTRMFWPMVLLVLIFFGALQYLVYLAAISPEMRLAMAPFFVTLILFALGIVVFTLLPVLRISAYVKAASERIAASRSREEQSEPPD